MTGVQTCALPIFELGDYLEEVHKIKPAAGGGGGGGPAPVVPEVVKKEEPTEFKVSLESFDPAKKINVIKVVREVTSLGLKEAKDLVDGAPKTVKEGVSKTEAEDIKKKFAEAGAKVDLK